MGLDPGQAYRVDARLWSTAPESQMRNCLTIFAAVLAICLISSACSGADYPMLPVRTVDVSVQDAAEPAFSKRLQEFGQERGFQFRRDSIAPAERGQHLIALERKDVLISGDDVFQRGDFRFNIYRKRQVSDVTDAELDQLLDAFVSSLSGVEGVRIIRLNRAPGEAGVAKE